MSQTAVVTGAGRGIGAATAHLLAEQGMRVGVLDIRLEEAVRTAGEIAEKGGQALAVQCDVSRRDDVERAIAALEERFGVPLVLVNNAGVGGPFHRADEVSDEEWDWIMNTNLRSVFLFCRNLLPKMKNERYGRIVNIASIQGLLGSSYSSTYAASKHGMIGYTRSIAAEWGKYGITCNAICPGYVDTSLGARKEAISDYMRRVLQRSPVQRVAAAKSGRARCPSGRSVRRIYQRGYLCDRRRNIGACGDYFRFGGTGGVRTGGAMNGEGAMNGMNGLIILAVLRKLVSGKRS